jgi:hypothetical protein
MKNLIYSASSTLPSSHPSSVQISSSVPCSLFSNTLSLCSSLNARDQVSHPHRTTCKIIVLHVLIFKFFDNRREDRSFWNEW